MMPAVFIGHGSPENALEKNEFTEAWKQLAREIPTPKAILSISAHWLSEGTAVTAMEKPRTIHDFYGFPQELYDVEYKAKGSLEHANLVRESVKAVKVSLDKEWGLDHGTWSVLVNMYSKADIPVIQLSLDYYLSLEKQYQLGKELKALREKGVLIMGSGNIVHNLGMITPEGPAYKWAVDFDSFVKKALEKRDDSSLINYRKAPSAELSHPTYDHYLPLLYVLGASENEKPRFLCEKIFYGSLSMRCAVFGIENRM